jgi:hypothetical protein
MNVAEWCAQLAPTMMRVNGLALLAHAASKL